MGPASLTAFSHVVAVEQKLWRQLGHLLAILDLHSGFNRLSEGHGVTGTTSLLVSIVTREINSINTPPIKMLGQLSIRDCRVICIFLLETLGLLQGLVKALASSKNISLLSIAFGLSEGDFLILLADGRVHLVTGLQLARVCLPTQV